MFNSRVYFGIVEDRDDRLALGRCKVRVAGMHTHNTNLLPTADLPWAIVMQPPGGSQIVAPVEGTPVVVVFADEPDCQIPIVIGSVATIPQSQAVWIDQFPNEPRVRDITDPEIGHSLPRNANEDSLSKVNEIRKDGPTEVDKNNAKKTVNNADKSTSGSIKTAADSSTIPTAQGCSPKAASIRQTFGKENPTIIDRMVVESISSGSANKTVEVFAQRLQSVLGSDALVKIVRGETSLSAELGKIQSSIVQANGIIGSTLVDRMLSAVIDNNELAGLKGIGTSLKDLAGNVGGVVNGVGSVTGIIGNIGNEFGNLSNIFNGGLSFDNIGNGLDAIGNILNGIGNLGSGLGSLVTGDNGLSGAFNSLLEGDFNSLFGGGLGDLFDDAGDYIGSIFDDPGKLIGDIGDLASGVIDDVSGMVGDVTDAIGDFIENGISFDSLDSFSGPGGKKLSEALLGQTLDLITSQLYDLLNTGLSPLVFIDGVLEKIESFIPKIDKIMQTGAVAKMRENWDPDYTSEPLRAFISTCRSVLHKAINFVVLGGTMVIEYIGEMITKYAAIIFDIFGFAASIVSEIMSMLGLDKLIGNVVANLISQFLPGGNGSADLGVSPQAAITNITQGTYSAQAFQKTGNKLNLDKIGSGKVTTTMFGSVGDGNTAPIHGQWGGPNFGGGVLPNKTTTIKKTNTVSQTSRVLENSVPDIPLTVYGVTNSSTVKSNISTIINSIQSLLPTVESQAAFLALSFAYTHCVPVIRDYEYTDKQVLLMKFPRSFSRASDNTINEYLFARTRNKKTAESFYNFVYDSANDGHSLGNKTTGDGYKYAESGLLPIVGRNSYTVRGLTNGASDLTGDLNKAIQVGVADFKEAVGYFPMGSVNIIKQALDSYPSIDKATAIAAFEHFYGAKIFDNYKVTNKVAGTQFDRISYYGSAQEKIPSTGFQDPNGKYPYVRNQLKSTINPLARGDVVNTIVASKEANRKIGVPIAGSQQTWEQPHSGYAAVYPYNNVTETESGHVIEYDDTPGAERLHWYHRTGTFEEINNLGTKTTKIVGDKYEIIDRNGFISISGQANVTVGGNINILCMSDVNVEVNGSTEIQTHGNLNLAAANDVNISAGGNINLWANDGLNTQANNNVNIRSTQGSVYMTGQGTVSIVAGDTAYFSSEKDLFINGANDVAIEAEEGTVDILAEQAMSVSSTNGALELYGGSNAFLTGGRNLSLFAGLGIHSECLMNYSILATGWYRMQASAVDQTILTYSNTSVTGLYTLNVGGAMTTQVGGVLSTKVGGAMSTSVGAALTTQVGGAYALNVSGTVGIDGTLVALNSGFGRVPADIPTITAPLLVGGAAKATCASGAPVGEKAVIYGMATIMPKAPLYPVIPPLSTEVPIVDREQIIEDLDQLNTIDGQSIQKHVLTENGYCSWVEGPTISPKIADDITHNDSPFLATLASSSIYTANTKISDHFNLGDFFDGGFNKKHVLQDQCGLTKSQIVDNIANTAQNVLEKIGPMLPGGFEGYRKYWVITSGYRMTNNNATIAGASKTSQHLTGQAVDIQIIGGSKSDHYNLIQKIASNCRFDQLILEYSTSGRSAWIHCSYDTNKARHQCLTINLLAKKSHTGFVLYS